MLPTHQAPRFPAYARPKTVWQSQHERIEAHDIYELRSKLGEKRFRNDPYARETRVVLNTNDLHYRDIPHVRFLPRTALLPEQEKRRVLDQFRSVTNEALDKPQRPNDQGFTVSDYDLRHLQRLGSELEANLDGSLREALFWQIGEWLQPGWINELYQSGHSMAEIALISGRKHTYPTFTTEGALVNLTSNWVTVGSKCAEKWSHNPFQHNINNAQHESMRGQGLWFNTIVPEDTEAYDAMINKLASYSYDEYVMARMPDTMLFASQFWTYSFIGVFIALNPVPPSLVLAQGLVDLDRIGQQEDDPNSLEHDIKNRHGLWKSLYAQLFRGLEAKQDSPQK